MEAETAIHRPDKVPLLLFLRLLFFLNPPGNNLWSNYGESQYAKSKRNKRTVLCNSATAGQHVSLTQSLISSGIKITKYMEKRKEKLCTNDGYVLIQKQKYIV